MRPDSRGDGRLMRVTVIGDATVDVTVRPAAALRPGGDTPARISLSPGGQGANVAVRLARAGAEVRLVTAIADDEVGRLLATALEADGVALVRLRADRSPMVVALLDVTGERTMLSDRVSLATPIAAASAEPSGSTAPGTPWRTMPPGIFWRKPFGSCQPPPGSAPAEDRFPTTRSDHAASGAGWRAPVWICW
jgi:NAD(P)-dependent dehydrogenase (short-subunit alcohol dehydrogenase family)